MSSSRDVVVIGAGINGLSAAWALAQRVDARRVTLVDQFRIGHDRGSSHGASRITRTSYADARYARMALTAQREDWPRLERDAGVRLVHPTPGLFFGAAGGGIDAYERAALAAGSPVDRVDPSEARRRFPQFRFDGGVDGNVDGNPTVLVDRSAGVIAAAETIAALARLVRAAGVDLREETRVERLEPRTGHVDVVTDKGRLAADRVIVTAGAWVSRLVPSLAARLTVARQTVCYFEPGGGAEDDWRAPRFPVWVWLGRDDHDHVCGLPEFGRPGIKAARHATGEGSDDADDAPGAPPQAALDDVREFLGRELAVPPRRLIAWERCLYTNEPQQEFILGPLPREPRIIVGAACSGHAFKFGPLTGRVLAEMALSGATPGPDVVSPPSDLAP